MRIVKAACTWKPLVTHSSLFFFELGQDNLLLNGRWTWTCLPICCSISRSQDGLLRFRRRSLWVTKTKHVHPRKTHLTDCIICKDQTYCLTEFALIFEMIFLQQFLSWWGIMLHPLLVSCLVALRPPPLPPCFSHHRSPVDWFNNLHIEPQ